MSLYFWNVLVWQLARGRGGDVLYLLLLFRRHIPSFSGQFRNRSHAHVRVVFFYLRLERGEVQEKRCLRTFDRIRVLWLLRPLLLALGKVLHGKGIEDIFLCFAQEVGECRVLLELIRLALKAILLEKALGRGLKSKQGCGDVR